MNIILTSNGIKPRISRSSKLVKTPNTLTFCFPFALKIYTLCFCMLFCTRRWAWTTSVRSLPSVLSVKGTGQNLHGGGKMWLESYFSTIFSLPKATALSIQLLSPFASLICTRVAMALSFIDIIKLCPFLRKQSLYRIISSHKVLWVIFLSYWGPD